MSTDRPPLRASPPDAPPASLPARDAVRSAELERTALLFALLFLATMLLVVGRTARDALFLTRFPVTWIAPMWMVYAAASAAVALVYPRIVARLPRARVLVAFTGFAAVSYVVLRVLIGQEVRAAYLVFYVWSEVIANFTAVLVWALAQDLHDARSAKRFFSLIGAGRVVGVVVSGFAAGVVVASIGTTNLILVLVGALVAISALTVVVARRHPQPVAAPTGDRAIDARIQRAPVWRSRYVLSLTLTTLLLFAVLTVGDYQFKVIARAEYPATDDLARFMANFYGVVGAAGLVVQLVITGPLLRRFGVIAGMMALPLAFAASTGVLLASPGIVAASLLKGSDNGLQFTLHEATMQLLYFPFPAGQRDRVRTLVGAISKPLGYGLGAMALLLIAPSLPAAAPGAAIIEAAARLGLYTLPPGAALLLAVLWLRKGYLRAMRRTLMRREIEPASVVNSPSTRAILLEALHSPDAPQVLFAVDRLREIDLNLVRDALPELARHRSARVRGLALRLSCELHDARGPDLARAALADADASVRVAAVDTIAGHLREDAHEELDLLADRRADPAVRAAAIAALLRQCGLDGMLDGAPRLRALLDSEEPADRIDAARVLGMVGEASLQRALARLIQDREPAVRRAAIQASCTACDPRLLPLLLDALAEKAVAVASARAIVAMGDVAVSHLGVRLGDPRSPRSVRLAIPRILYRMESQHGLTVLLAYLDERDEGVRQKILASASRLRLALQAPPLAPGEVRPRIDRELALHEAARDDYVPVRAAVAGPLLDAYVIGGLRKGLIRILRLCELAYPREVVAAVRAHLFGPDAALRANSFEVLESLLDPALRRHLVAQVERFLRLRAGDNRRTASFLRLRAGGNRRTTIVSSVDQDRVTDWLRAQLRGADPYGVALALDAIAQHRIQGAGLDALAATTHVDPLVREAAAIAVAVTAPPGGAAALERLRGDPDPVVAGYARYWAETGRAGIEPDDSMYTTIEKVIFLQRVPIFAKVAGEDLVPLARGSAVVALPRGEVIFHQGDPGDALYFIVSGVVALSMDGREIARLGESEVFGELSIFDRELRTVTAAVAEDAEVLRVSAEDFHDALRDTAEIAEAVIKVLQRRLREADRQLVAARARQSLAPKPASGGEPPAEAEPAAAEPAVDGAPRAEVDEPNPLE